MSDETTPPEREEMPAADAATSAREEAPADEGAEAVEPQPPEPAEPQAPEAEAVEAQPPEPAEPQAPEAEAAEAPTPDEPRPARPRRARPRRNRQRRDRGPRQPQPRSSGPLPFQELRDAATTVVDLFGARQALRDAFAALGDKERRDLARLVAEDGDWRVRARNIAAGSLGAGRVGKALAAQQISMARVEDLWPLTLSKEEAAARQARVRNARRRDERRAQREADRERRSDRVSRADLERAQDGRVGAQIRIVIGRTERKRKGDEPRKDDDKQGSNVLDRLGY